MNESVFNLLHSADSLLAVECTMLKEMHQEAWCRLRRLKRALPEDYHAWMIVIMKLEKELGEKCFQF